MLEDSTDDLYEHAPSGHLSTLLDGTIAKINTTLLGWLGFTRTELVGIRRFSDLLTVGGKIYHETHYAPLLAMQGEVSGVALDLRAKDGTKLPVLVTSIVKTGLDGQPLLIRTTVFDARDRRAYEQELLRANKATADALRAAEHAVEEAHAERARLRTLIAALQRSLLPRALVAPPGMDTAAYYHTASADEVGGDFYDLFPLGDDRWGFFLGDVCGKGVEAAAITALTRYTLRAAAVYDPDPATVLANLNTVLCQEHVVPTHRYCTVVFGILGPATAAGRTAAIAGGGHPDSLILHADGTAAYEHTTTGPIVGIFPQARFTSTVVDLAPGDTLILYTDGLTDARYPTSPDGRYSSRELLDLAQDLAPASATVAVAALTDLITSFGNGLDDDTAVMALSMPDRT